MRIRLAHSPDPDDAFMFYGLAQGAIDAGPYEFEHVLADIQTLNERARPVITKSPPSAFMRIPTSATSTRLTACGSSMGTIMGRWLSATALSVAQLGGQSIAVPGRMTTAFLVLQLLLGKDGFTPQVVMFDQIPSEVLGGRVAAGLLIHEGQLTYAQQRLHAVIDLGVWWHERTGLPLPLGGNAIRRDLGQQRCREITDIIRRSIRYGLEHRAEAVRYALQFGRGLDTELADRFVGMYVNEWTLDYGPRGREAVRRLLADGAAAGLVPPVSRLDFID